MNRSEEERIRGVYSYYDATASEQRKRDKANPGNVRNTAERLRVFAAMLAALPVPLEQARILDVGCGRGDLLAWLRAQGASAPNLAGVDLLESRVAEARAAYPEIRFEAANAESLPFPSGSFDAAACTTLFSSILDADVAGQVAAEVSRVLAPRSAILWYDLRYPNPSNPNVRGVRASEIARLFPGFRLDLRSATLLPPLARRLGNFGALHCALAALPPLRSHLVGVLVRDAI